MITQPLLLDGAMGQEIVNRGGKAGYSEWAVAALYENPQIVTDIHHEYLQAGADIITTNTYTTNRARLSPAGLEHRFEELVHLAGSLAQNARNNETEKRPNVLIAGSIGPLEASYISDFTLSYDEMVAQFDELMTLLKPYADVYLAETFSTIIEARAFLTAAKNHNKRTWLAWTLDDHGSTTLRGGESLAEAIDSIQGFAPDAILLNCTTPDSISASISTLRKSDIPFGGYANGFVEIPNTWEPQYGVSGQISSRIDLTPEKYKGHVSQWIDAGAAIVGGCCEISPKHIATLRHSIDRRSQN